MSQTARTPDSYYLNSLDDYARLLPQLRSFGPQVNEIGRIMVDCWNGGGKLLIAGNGGSAADAMHFAEELVVRYHRDRRALAAIALLDQTVLTCAGNDYGYDAVFSRQIEALGKPGDVFVGFTTSGNSANIVRAFEVARQQGVKTVGFLGKAGGACKALCDVPLVVQWTGSAARIQEAHQIIYHSLCEYVDAWLLGDIPG